MIDLELYYDIAAFIVGIVALVGFTHTIVVGMRRKKKILPETDMREIDFSRR